MPVTTVSDPLPTPHSSEAERLRRIVADAWSATDPVADQVDSETRQTAFKLLLEAMLQNGGGARPEIEPPESNGVPDAITEESFEVSIDDALATEIQRADAVAGYLGIDDEDVATLYELCDSEPQLRLSTSKLDSQPAAAIGEITLLVAAARSALGLETGTEHVRAAADAHDTLDPLTFDSTIAAMTDIALRGHPDSKNRLIRLRGKGVEAARALAQRLVGA